MGWYFPSINAVVSRTDFQIAIDFWLKEYSESLEIKHAESRLYDRIEEMQTDFANGELSFIVAPPLLIVRYFDLNSLADGFIGTSVTDKPYGIVVLARKDKRIDSIKDLLHKRLILPANDELAKVFLDSLVITQLHQRYNNALGSVQYLQKQNAIIHKLFFNEADVGVAYLETFELMVELNPQIKEKIKILETFPINSPNYSFFHNSFPMQERELAIETALKLHHSTRSQEILNNFRMSTLVKCTVDSLEPFIQLNRKYTQLLRSIEDKSYVAN